ncbi:MAG: DinB family protein [Bryobacteraceae bacterium]|nr:DinB family protein [Bryobacteraceae bacterium]
MGSEFADACIPVLARTPATFDALLRGLPEDWTHVTEGPGTWSPRMIISHLIHAERTDWVPRIKLILEHGPGRPFAPFDREPAQAYGESLSSLLDEFSFLRQENLLYLRSLHFTPELLARQGTHPAFGLVSLRQLLATWTAHDLAHLVQVSRVMAKSLKGEVGPWAQYLSVMQ